MAEGRLFYLVGASGVAKDSLVDYVRSRPREHQEVIFAHRYTTRTTGTGRDNQVVLTETEFLLRQRHGLFVMDWESQGSHYGIGAEINYWLAVALSVVVSGSRSCLERAFKRYPDMIVVWISAAPDLGATRRAARVCEPCRGREERIVRSPMVLDHAGGRLVHISNDRSIKTAGENLLAVLHGN